MRDFLDQVEIAANTGGLYYLALAGALAIPDMCGALESANGEADGTKYRAWFDQHIAQKHIMPRTSEQFLSSDECWRFRCSFLHQGRMMHPRSRYSRIAFFEPNQSPVTMHMNVFGDLLTIDVRKFCLEMVEAARVWLDGITGTEPYETNFNSFVRRYPEGIPRIGTIMGPVIA